MAWLLYRSLALLLVVIFLGSSFFARPPKTRGASFKPPPLIPTDAKFLSKPPSRIKAPGRLLSIPDLHGDYEGFLGILRKTRLINLEDQWIGDNAVLVQTGDVCDRGDYSAEILRLIYKLGKEAELVGGKVIMLLGNHELLNLQGLFYYATEGETEGFGGSSPARLKAFSNQGEFGSFLRSLPSALVIERENNPDGNTLFVHGGLLPEILHEKEFKEDLVGALNNRIHRMLAPEQQDLLKGRNQVLFGEYGPFWNRFFALTEDESKVCSQLLLTLDLAKAKKMVVGHTVQTSGVRTRCGGRLVLSDVGFADYYHGPKLALEHSVTGDTNEIRL